MKSHYVVPGLYFYDNSVVEIAKNIHLTVLGKYEIIDERKEYIKQDELHVGIFDCGTAWLDTRIFTCFTTVG